MREGRGRLAYLFAELETEAPVILPVRGRVVGESRGDRLGRDLLRGDASAETLVAVSPIHLSASTPAPSCAKFAKRHRRSVLGSVSINSPLDLAFRQLA